MDRIGNVVVGSGTSGHGFKFGPLLGEWLADLAAGTAGGPVAGARGQRFALRRFPPMARPQAHRQPRGGQPTGRGPGQDNSEVRRRSLLRDSVPGTGSSGRTCRSAGEPASRPPGRQPAGSGAAPPPRRADWSGAARAWRSARRSRPSGTAPNCPRTGLVSLNRLMSIGYCAAGVPCTVSSRVSAEARQSGPGRAGGARACVAVRPQSEEIASRAAGRDGAARRLAVRSPGHEHNDANLHGLRRRNRMPRSPRARRRAWRRRARHAAEWRPPPRRGWELHAGLWTTC